MWIQKQQDMILCGLGTWTNYGSPPLRWEKWWRSLRLGTLCSDPFSWNQWKWGNFSPGNEGLTDKMEIFYQGDWTNRVMKNQRTTSFFYVDIESGPRKIILLAQICPNPGAWKLDGLLLEMTKMWLPALQIRPVSLNILNIETAWEKLWRLKFEKGMFVSRHVNRTIWCIYKNLTTIMSQLALWSLKLANN